MELKLYTENIESYLKCNKIINYDNAKGNVEKEAWFDNILDFIKDMEYEDVLLVYDFGIHGNEKLWMTIDDDEDVRIETDIWVHHQNGDDGQVNFVDRTYIERNETEEIRKVLDRLWREEFEGTE